MYVYGMLCDCTVWQYHILVCVVVKGMPYMPAAASLAAAHKGKIKNICRTTLRETKDEHNPWVVIISFEKEAMAYDRQQVLKTGAVGMYNISSSLKPHSTHFFNLAILSTGDHIWWPYLRVPKKRDHDSKAHHEQRDCGRTQWMIPWNHLTPRRPFNKVHNPPVL